MADTPRTIDPELLAELQPLAAVIADKIRTVPVSFGPGGTDNLIAELTLAIAIYCARNVLPKAPITNLPQPPWPTETDWTLESQWRDGRWRTDGPARNDRDDALQRYNNAVQHDGNRRPYRLVRATTTYTIETEHAPEQP
ncbi:hypothetical protein [Streptomyces acidiscabies]|uniref:hypothetical protein n=1 Tax=Streptomyces acidiscabies TaxID=42234 RepID=UPI00073EFB22|nr:hypothetical protein [Streptomyces acidiscabies]GAQ52101.1 hypothetical protein a10_01882 [Streptomyces acidiscabies]